MAVKEKISAMGRRIRETRVSMSLNQKDFAKIGNVGITTQQQYEAGKTSPTAEYLYHLEATGLDIGYLLTGRRSDGSAGMLENQILAMYDQLDDSEKGVVFNLLCVLTGNMLHTGPTRQSFATALHERGREFKGEDE